MKDVFFQFMLSLMEILLFSYERIVKTLIVK